MNQNSKIPEGLRTFKDFWPYYVRDHLHPKSRLLHFIGTLLSATLLVGGILVVVLTPADQMGPSFELVLVFCALVVLIGYGFAFSGHYLVEGNRPATFRYPLFSLMADFRMVYLMTRGKMRGEVERVLRGY